MAGSRDADFMEFVRARSLALRRTAYLLCGDWSAGDDLVQESLAKVYVAWPRIAASQAVESYTRTTMLRTYLNEGVHHVAVDRLRSRTRRRSPRSPLP